MQPTMAAESFSTLRNTHGSAIFTGKLGKPGHQTNYAARFAFRSGIIGSELLHAMDAVRPDSPTKRRADEASVQLCTRVQQGEAVI